MLDLRRLRCGDPVADALAAAFAEIDGGRAWTVELEREDVCPIATIPSDATGLDDVLATLGKKERHEIRRKLRRAEAVGPVALVESADPLTDLDAFIDLHQRRWGDHGLFPPTPGGDASRVFVRRLFETFGPGGAVRLCFLTVAGRRIGAGITFEDGDTIALLQRRGRPRRPRPVARGRPDRQVRRAGHRDRSPAARLPARRRGLQVRVGRGRRADPAAADPAEWTDDRPRRRRSLPRAGRPSGAPGRPRPGGRGPGDRLERRCPGARVRASDPDRPDPLRRPRRVARRRAARSASSSAAAFPSP